MERSSPYEHLHMKHCCLYCYLKRRHRLTPPSLPSLPLLTPTTSESWSGTRRTERVFEVVRVGGTSLSASLSPRLRSLVIFRQRRTKEKLFSFSSLILFVSLLTSSCVQWIITGCRSVIDSKLYIIPSDSRWFSRHTFTPCSSPSVLCSVCLQFSLAQVLSTVTSSKHFTVGCKTCVFAHLSSIIMGRVAKII